MDVNMAKLLAKFRCAITRCNSEMPVALVLMLAQHCHRNPITLLKT